MVQEVWFQLVNTSGEALSSADCIDCADDAKVFRLRDAVKAKYADSHLVGVAPSDLRVYANRAAFDAKQPLRLSDSLKDRDSDEDNALIVVVPEKKVAPTDNDQWKTMIDELQKSQEATVKGVLEATIDEMKQNQEATVTRVLEEQQKRARECVAMSRMSSAKRRRLLDQLKLPVEVLEVREPRISNKGKVPVFVWDMELTEDKQVAGEKGYKKYLADNFGSILTPRGLCFEYVADNHNLLDIVDERLPFDLSGGANVLVLKDLGDLTAENVHHLNGLRLVIELKKDLERERDKHESQSIAELIAVNLRAPDKSAVVLLTDLRHRWNFMWLSDDRKIRKLTVKEPANAAAFVNAIVSRDDLSVHIPFPGAPRVPRRGNLETMIPSEEGDILGEMVERYRAIASELGPDMNMAREIGWQVVKQMPAYSAMYT